MDLGPPLSLYRLPFFAFFWRRDYDTGRMGRIGVDDRHGVVTRVVLRLNPATGTECIISVGWW